MTTDSNTTQIFSVASQGFAYYQPYRNKHDPKFSHRLDGDDSHLTLLKRGCANSGGFRSSELGWTSKISSFQILRGAIFASKLCTGGPLCLPDLQSPENGLWLSETPQGAAEKVPGKFDVRSFFTDFGSTLKSCHFHGLFTFWQGKWTAEKCR